MQFRNEYWFLSNMYPCKIRMYSKTFQCAEAAFQAHKCWDRADEFTTLDGFAAKKLGRSVNLRSDWQTVKDNIMESVVKNKFLQHPELLEKLNKIKGQIQEDNTWHDTYWGVCNGYGKNKLGKILMNIRDNSIDNKLC